MWNIGNIGDAYNWKINIQNKTNINECVNNILKYDYIVF